MLAYITRIGRDPIPSRCTAALVAGAVALLIFQFAEPAAAQSRERSHDPVLQSAQDGRATKMSRSQQNILRLDTLTEFVKLTAHSTLVAITLQLHNRDLTFLERDGVERGIVSVSGRMTTPAGEVAETFEDTLRLDVPPELLDKVLDNVALYWKVFPMPPGNYRLDIIAKDANGDKLGRTNQSVEVPEFPRGKLAASTLIVADVAESVPSREAGIGSFVLGTMKIRPRVASNGRPATFKRSTDRKINFWMQVYNLALDEKSHKPWATIEYQVVNNNTGKKVVDFTESTSQMAETGDELTLQKSLPLSSLDPGTYQLTISIHDLVSNQTIAPTAIFAVE